MFQTSNRNESAKNHQSHENKKSAGADELTQENMIHGAENLAASLTKIINKSIIEGSFPQQWKHKGLYGRASIIRV